MKQRQISQRNVRKKGSLMMIVTLLPFMSSHFCSFLIQSLTLPERHVLLNEKRTRREKSERKEQGRDVVFFLFRKECICE